MRIEELDIFEKCLTPVISSAVRTIGFPIYTNFESWLLNNDGEIQFGLEENRDFIDEIKRKRLIEISKMVFNDNMKWICFLNGKLEGIPEHGEQLSIGPYHIYFDKKKWRELRINSLI